MRSTFTAEAKWTRAVSSPCLHTGLHGGEAFRAALHDLRRVRTALGTERRWARVVAGGRGSAFFRDAPTVHDGLHGRKNTPDSPAASFVTTPHAALDSQRWRCWIGESRSFRAVARTDRVTRRRPMRAAASPACCTPCHQGQQFQIVARLNSTASDKLTVTALGSSREARARLVVM